MTEAPAESRIALLGFPCDHNSSFLRGAALAPPLIRGAFRTDASNYWTESGMDLGSGDVIFDAGDQEVSVDNAVADIEGAVSRVLERGLTPIFLGGDHFVTYPILRAFRRKYPALAVLHFDAHPDIYDEFLGNRHSHACPFARIMEEGLAQRLVQVGIRTMTAHQREQAQRFGVEVHEMRSCGRQLPELTFDAPLYISLDMDVLDPAFAPGVSHQEPGGLTTRQLIDMIQSVRAQFVGADIVEFNPRRDRSGITAMACAKLLKELAARMA